MKPTSAPSDPYLVGPVVKALNVLQCVAREGRELNLTEICYKVGLPKTTVYRYLHTLCAAGLLSHDPVSDMYRSGLGLWSLGQSCGTMSIVREAAYPILVQLRDRFNETVNLAQLEGHEVVYIEMVESRRSLRTQAKLGSREPVYSTSLGKAMLAFLPEETWAEYLPSPIPARTSHTITSKDAFLRSLREVRAHFYATDYEENEEGLCCIGSPVLTADGKPIAAVSVSAPTSRLAHGNEVGAAVREAADTIARILAI